MRKKKKNPITEGQSQTEEHRVEGESERELKNKLTNENKTK